MITLGTLIYNVIAPLQDVEIFSHSTGKIYLGRAEYFRKRTNHEYDDYLVDAVYTVSSDDIICISVSEV